MRRLRIVSGGQTGVDRAALDAAINLALPCGGWCPAGRRAEDGPIDRKYPLMETHLSDYAERTVLNVRDSEATLILDFMQGRPETGVISKGTELAVRTAIALDKPLHRVRISASSSNSPVTEEVSRWMDANYIEILNVAGPRESEAPGIYATAFTLITDLLIKRGDA